MYEKSQTNITFMYKHEGYADEYYKYPATSIVYNIDGESTLTEICDAFQNFILSCGFRLNSGETIGVLNND